MKKLLTPLLAVAFVLISFTLPSCGVLRIVEKEKSPRDNTNALIRNPHTGGHYLTNNIISMKARTIIYLKEGRFVYKGRPPATQQKKLQVGDMVLVVPYVTQLGKFKVSFYPKKLFFNTRYLTSVNTQVLFRVKSLK